MREDKIAVAIRSGALTRICSVNRTEGSSNPLYNSQRLVVAPPAEVAIRPDQRPPVPTAAVQVRQADPKRRRRLRFSVRLERSSKTLRRSLMFWTTLLYPSGSQPGSGLHQETRLVEVSQVRSRIGLRWRNHSPSERGWPTNGHARSQWFDVCRWRQELPILGRPKTMSPKRGKKWKT